MPSRELHPNVRSRWIIMVYPRARHTYHQWLPNTCSIKSLPWERQVHCESIYEGKCESQKKRFNWHVNALWPLQMPHFSSHTPSCYLACSTCIRNLRGLCYQPLTFCLSIFFPFLLRGRLESVERRIPPYCNDRCVEVSESKQRGRLFIITDLTWEEQKQNIKILCYVSGSTR